VRQLHVQLTGQFAGEAFSVDDDAGGKVGCPSASRSFLKAGQAFNNLTVTLKVRLLRTPSDVRFV
jgi:hypothetical protein